MRPISSQVCSSPNELILPMQCRDSGPEHQSLHALRDKEVELLTDNSRYTDKSRDVVESRAVRYFEILKKTVRIHLRSVWSHCSHHVPRACLSNDHVHQASPRPDSRAILRSLGKPTTGPSSPRGWSSMASEATPRYVDHAVNKYYTAPIYNGLGAATHYTTPSFRKKWKSYTTLSRIPKDDVIKVVIQH